jgi:hypothetical protein
MTYIERIIDVQTNEIVERPYTAKEIAEVEAAKAEAETQRLAQEAKATAKAALLTKLGITADEAALLLGGN